MAKNKSRAKVAHVGRAPAGTTELVYSRRARWFHWWVVALIALQVPIGFAMTWRGNTLGIWDGLTNNLYSAHKLLGVVLLVFVLARLFYRLRHGAPADEPGLHPLQRFAAHVTHWSLYGLLLVVPLLGWLGVSRYPALDIFGLFKLPGLLSPDQAASGQLFFLHKWLAILMLALVAAHVGAALMHYVVLKDNVLRRMLPSLPKR
jgi:cytochrome b561